MKKQTYSSSFVILTVLAFIGFAGYMLSVWLVKDTVESASVIENEIEKKKEQNVAFESLKNLVEETENDRRVVSGYLADQNVVGFLEKIEELARVSEISLEIKNVELNTSLISEEKVELLDISMVGSGSWGNLEKFTRLVETLPQGVRINKLNMFKIETNEDGIGGKWEGSFGITVWKLK